MRETRKNAMNAIGLNSSMALVKPDIYCSTTRHRQKMRCVNALVWLTFIVTSGTIIHLPRDERQGTASLLLDFVSEPAQFFLVLTPAGTYFDPQFKIGLALEMRFNLLSRALADFFQHRTLCAD